MAGDYIFTSESVSEGHPDKVADQISDAIVDALLAQDPASRIACETLVKNNTVILAGEITTQAEVDYEAIARETIREIGYTDKELGFDCDSCEVLQFLNAQSPDIAQGVNESNNHEQGAGDQGLMFGYACNETPELMPLPISLSHNILKRLADIRKRNVVDFLRPDSKSQVTIKYENGIPVAVDTIVVSTQHAEHASHRDLEELIRDSVIDKVIPAEMLSEDTRLLINPTGRFVIGGPVGDSGLTGRKIIVDTYGGAGRHGGGAFSGKDPSKVDRSAAYAARHVAKNIIAAGLANACEVQLAYAIGVAEPVSINVHTFGSASLPESEIEKIIKEQFSLTPRMIIESLDLLKPIYKETARYGHFGRKPRDDGHFSWERTDKAAALKQALAA